MLRITKSMLSVAAETSKLRAILNVPLLARSMKVWGVGVHEDVVQSSLIALLSAASNVCVLFSSHSSFVLANMFLVHHKQAKHPVAAPRQAWTES
jgi:hypothetical protein